MKPGANRSGSARAQLSPRQWQVARALALGQSVKEAASDLKLSAKTVEYHWDRVRQVLGVRDPVGLVWRLLRSGDLGWTLQQRQRSGAAELHV